MHVGPTSQEASGNHGGRKAKGKQASLTQQEQEEERKGQGPHIPDLTRTYNGNGSSKAEGVKP